MVKLCQRVLVGKGISGEWKTCVAVPIDKGKVDVLNCRSYIGIKQLKHSMKIIVERVLETGIQILYSKSR